MKTKLKYISILALATSCLSQDLPEKPKSQPVFTKTDYSLISGLVISNTLDFTSTEHGLTKPTWQWHENELPDVIVKNEAGFAVFTAVKTGAQILGYYELSKHGHRKIARWITGGSIATGLFIDGKNYKDANQRWCYHTKTESGCLS